MFVVEGVFVFFRVLRHKNNISKIRPSGKLRGAGQLLGEGTGPAADIFTKQISVGQS